MPVTSSSDQIVERRFCLHKAVAISAILARRTQIFSRGLQGRRAITGGTGEYQTARGEVESRTQGEQTILTFHLIRTP